jgi:hypothetical protein
MEFVAKAAADQPFYEQVKQATGPLDFRSITDEQFRAAVQVGRESGYDFTESELRAAHTEVESAVRAAQEGETDSTGAEVAGYVLNPLIATPYQNDCGVVTQPDLYGTPQTFVQ